MDSTKDTAGPASYVDIMEKNHMEIPWHDYAKADSNVLIENAGLIEKASVIGRVGLMMLSCGTLPFRGTIIGQTAEKYGRKRGTRPVKRCVPPAADWGRSTNAAVPAAWKYCDGK